MKATGERCERRRGREERAERVAAVGRWGRRFDADEDAGHRDRNCPPCWRPWSYCDPERNPPHPPHPWRRPLTYNIDIFRLVSAWYHRFCPAYHREVKYLKTAADHRLVSGWMFLFDKLKVKLCQTEDLWHIIFNKGSDYNVMDTTIFIFYTRFDHLRYGFRL